MYSFIYCLFEIKASHILCTISKLEALFRQQQSPHPCTALYQAFSVMYRRRKNSLIPRDPKHIGRVTQGVVPAAEEIFVFDLQYMIYYPLKFLAVINVLCLNGSNIPFNSWNHGYAFRTEQLRVIGITPWAWIRMEGYKPLCFCVLQLDNDRRALALRSIVLNVSPFNKIKGQFVIVYLLLRRQVHIFYESTVVHEL